MTERRTLPETLGDPEADLRFFRALAEGCHSLIWTWNVAEHRLEYMSAAAEALWGRSPEDLYRKPELWFEWVHPDDRARAVGSMSRLEAGTYTDDIFRVVCADGTARWVRGRGFPACLEGDKVTRAVGVIDDLTHLRVMTESTRVLTRALEEVTESVVIATGELDAISFVNGAFTRMTGYPADEIVGKSPTVLGEPWHDTSIFDPSGAWVSQGQPFSTRGVMYRRDGTELAVEWDIVAVKNDAGAVTDFIAVQRDVTALQRVQVELIEARKLAEAADHAKSAFLASMSHELRTPLNAIIGFSELLEEASIDPLTERQQKYVRNVLSAGRSLLDLIDQVLDLTQVDVGRMILHLTRFELADVLQDVQTLVRALADRKRLLIRMEVDERLPQIRADARKLKQILYSLVSNAIRTASEGSELVLKAERVGGSSDWIGITVARPGADATGTFPQDVSAYGLEHPQSGLGLALSQRLVELHGGRVWVESRASGGATFRLVLPLEAKEDPATIPTSSLVAEAQGNNGGPLVLVVEDNAQAGELLSHYLMDAGYSVARAFNGADAVRLASELHPAVITMDSELPDRNGLDVLAQLRASPQTREIPAVVVSVIDRRNLASSRGVRAWLVKPVNRHEFVSVVHQVIHSGRARIAPSGESSRRA